jgi:hypothetical protein
MSFASGLIQNNAENDSYTKLLLHMEGPDPNWITSDSSPSRQGRIQVPDTTRVVLSAIPKFGATSLRIANSYFYMRSSQDYDFDAGDFTIDWWERRSDKNVNRPSMCRDVGVDSYQAFLLGWCYATTAIVYQLQSLFSTDGTTWGVVLDHSWGAPDTWYHLAVVRKGGTIYAFKDGVITDSKPISGSLTRHNGAIGFGYY